MEPPRQETQRKLLATFDKEVERQKHRRVVEAVAATTDEGSAAAEMDLSNKQSIKERCHWTTRIRTLLSTF